MKIQPHHICFVSLTALFIMFVCLAGAWSKKPDPCNPIKLPVTYENQIGNEITFDSIWNEGLIIRNFEGKKTAYIITKYHKK